MDKTGLGLILGGLSLASGPLACGVLASFAAGAWSAA